MAKVALLIGVSDYGEGLKNLPGTQVDLQAMQRVLQSPKIGGFDTVKVLSNPDRSQMELAIETLFSEKRTRDDLILLYFSGHGVRDNSGALYFATRTTQKNSSGTIFTSTAVPASEVRRYMSGSCSKRQVLILDCCFSGAFANDMKAKAAEIVIDVKAQLGAEGRAVLTSSTETQVSLENDRGGIYTHYLVQGLETGAADRNSDGQITVDELHDYAKEKVQEAAPAMRPEIYAAREGYKILLARAPQGDPKLIFRKELDARAKQKRGKLSPIDQRAFKFRAQELEISAQDAEAIINEVLQPYQVFWEKVDEFEQAVKDTLEFDPQMSEASIDDLQFFQQTLKLRDEDIASVLATYRVNLVPPAQPPSATPTAVTSSPKPLTSKPELQPPESIKFVTPDSLDALYESMFGDLDLSASSTEDDLSSEKGIDYIRLRDLLKAGDWEAADQETNTLMLRVMKEENWFGVEREDLLNFPCTDLKTIDRLWVSYSNSNFGFSVQKQIYVECGAKLDGKYPGDEVWEEFCDRVGWRVKNQYIPYDFVKFNITAPSGHLPIGMGLRCWDGLEGQGRLWFFDLFSRTKTCKL